MVQHTIRTLAFGPYTATYIRWGKALNLHGQNRVELMGLTFHGAKNQQARAFCSTFCSELIVAAIHDRATSARGGLQLQNQPFTIRTVVGVPPRRCRFRHQQCLGRLVPRSSGHRTRDSRCLHGAFPTCWELGQWIIGVWRTAPRMKTETCMSGT